MSDIGASAVAMAPCQQPRQPPRNSSQQPSSVSIPQVASFLWRRHEHRGSFSALTFQVCSCTTCLLSVPVSL